MNQSLIVIAILAAVLMFALHRKSDVRATLKTSLFEFSLDAKDKTGRQIEKGE